MMFDFGRAGRKQEAVTLFDNETIYILIFRMVKFVSLIVNLTILAMQQFKERIRTMGLMDSRGRLTCELYYK